VTGTLAKKFINTIPDFPPLCAASCRRYKSLYVIRCRDG